MKLSMTTIVRNEVSLLPGLLDALQDYVDEFVFVDTGSTDGTIKVLESRGCKVLHADLGSFSDARNMGMANCTGDWIISFDADEMPTAELLAWVRKFVAKDGQLRDAHVNGIAFRRVNKLDGHIISEEMHVRLFRQGRGKWVGTIHEFVEVSGTVTSVTASKAYIAHDKTRAMQAQDDALYLTYYPKLNLGSGGRPISGWTNYDIDQEHAPESVHADVFVELPGSLPAAYILASHVLEHASYHKASDVLKMWIAKLAPGGIIEIRVPDAGAVVRDLVAGKLGYLQFLQGMYGGQTTEYDYHNIAIDEPWLLGQLTWWGCVDIKRLPGDPYELRMTARKP